MRRGAREALQFWETCQAVDDFNRDAPAIDPVDLAIWADRERPGGALPAPNFEPNLARWFDGLARVQSAAGYLASRLDRRLKAAECAVFLLLILAAAAFHLYAHPLGHAAGLPHPPGWLAMFLALLAAAVLLIGVVWVTRLDERRLDYRALAEALRVRGAWAAAGLGRSVASAYLGQLRTEMAWARRALQHSCPPPEAWAAGFSRLQVAGQLERLRFVRDARVVAQRDHFHGRQRVVRAMAKWLRVLGFAAAVLAWALVGSGLLIPDPVPEQPPRSLVEHPPPWLLDLASLLVITGGLAIVFSEQRAYDELAKQYERMGVVFENGLTELDRWLSENDVHCAQAVVLELGREAVAENAQWLVLRRSRPLELHFG